MAYDTVWRLICWSVYQSVCRLVCRLVCWLVCWSVCRLVFNSIDRSIVVGAGRPSPPIFIRYPTVRAAFYYELTTSKPGSSMGINTTIIVTLSCACALHEGMLQGVKLGMLWGTVKSTFCHRSTPNCSSSKNKVHPRIQHVAESSKYNYVYDR
jgi:hypothetical protein